MSNNNLELMEWGDGTVRLAYWDSLHGEDESFILHDGEAYVEDEKGFRVSVNLVDELIRMVKKINQKV